MPTLTPVPQNPIAANSAASAATSAAAALVSESNAAASAASFNFSMPNGIATLDANTEVVELSAGAAAEVAAGRPTNVKQANGAWASGGVGATGGGTDAVFHENDQAVTTNYTLTAGKNAMSAGIITINTGVTVTVPTGANWVIV